MRADAWQRCSGVATVLQSPYEIRDAWMAEGYAWHGLPARLGKATLADALGDIAASREAAKVPVKKAIRHRTRGNCAERERLYSLLKQNRWDEDPFLHRQMRKQWRGGRSHVTNQIVADAGSYTTKVWHDRAWVYLQGLERGQRIAIPLKGTHLPSGTLRILLRDNGQVEVHYAVDETQVCSTRPCGKATVGVDKGYTEAYADSDGERHGEGLGDLLSAESDHRKVKGTRRNHLRDTEQKHRAKGNHRKADTIRKNNLGNQKWDRRRTLHHKQVRDHLCQAAHTVVDKAGTIACEDLSASMKSARYRHKDTNRRLSGWVKGVMADTFTSISRRRGSAPALVNPAYTSQVDSRTGLLQGRRRWDRFYCLRRGCAGRGRQCRLQHSGEAVRRGDNVVHALQGGACPARGTNQDSGGDCSTRTRVAGACNGAPINRERITRTGTEMYQVKEQRNTTNWTHCMTRVR